MTVNRNIALGLIVFWMLLFVAYANAQDLVIAPVPAGISPVLQWVMGLTSSLLAVFVPLGVVWMKQHLAVQDNKTRSDMIGGAVVRAAHLADLDMTKQQLSIDQIGQGSPVMNAALGYVHDAHPNAIAATPQANDPHLSQAILAEVQKIQLAKGDSAAPTVVLSPVSAIR